MGLNNRAAKRNLIVLLLTLIMLATVLAPSSAFADITEISVTTLQDQNDGCSVNGCSLREGVSAAVANGGEVHVLLKSNDDHSPSIYTLDSEIPVSGAGDITLMPQWSTVGPNEVVINGTGGGGGHRLFVTSGSVSLEFQRVSLVNAQAPLGDRVGGAIKHSSTGYLRISSSYVGGNKAAEGGAIYRANNAGAIQIDLSHFDNNLANEDPGKGGAISAYGASQTSIMSSTFSSNGATGGAAPMGGAVYSSGSGSVLTGNSTFYGSYSKGVGGVFYVDGPAAPAAKANLTIVQSTLIHNRTDYGDAPYGDLTDLGAVLAAHDTALTIVANVMLENGRQTGATPDDYAANTCLRLAPDNTLEFFSYGFNRIQDGPAIDCGSGSFASTDTIDSSMSMTSLGVKAYVPFSTQSGGIFWPGHFPLELSSVLVNGITEDSLCMGGSARDIRGLFRVAGSHCDIGAYEFGALTDASLLVTQSTSTPHVGEDIRYVVDLSTVPGSDNDGLPGVNIVFEYSTAVTLQRALFTSGGGSCAQTSSTEITCYTQNMSATQSTQINIDVRLAAGTTTWTADADFLYSDPVRTNNSKSGTTVVAAAQTTQDDQDNDTQTPQQIVAPKLTLRGLARRTLFARNRTIRVKAFCPSGVSGGCRVQTTLRSIRRVNGRTLSARCGKLTIRPGETRSISCRFSKSSARHLSRRPGLRMRLTLTSRDSAGNARKLTLIRYVLAKKQLQHRPRT